MNNNTNEQIIKVCTLCHVVLPANKTYFGTCKKGKLGLTPRCKPCMKKLRDAKKEEKHQYYLKRYKKIKQQPELLEKLKTAKREYDREYRKKNKEEISLKRRKFYKENRERILENNRKWADKNLERVIQRVHKRNALKKQLPNNYTTEQWFECLAHFEGECAYCGRKETLEQEHFIPLSKGGEYTHNNIIPACRSCNASKNDKDFFEWYKSYECYTKKRERKILKYLNYNNNEQQLALL